MATQPGKAQPRAPLTKSVPRGAFKIPAVESGSSTNHPLSEDQADVVIVGNGIAGCIAAMETRQYAPDARILVITEQNHPTINTPALKQYGAGRLELEQLMAYSPGAERQLGIGVLHQRVIRIDPSSHQAHLAHGRAISYRSLLLATGALASPLPDGLPGRDFDGVLRLHTLSDYRDLRRRLPSVSSAVVIGGGYHAAETALLLRHQRVKVTWLIRGASLLPRLLDIAASSLLLRQASKHGVEVRLETEVAGIVGKMGTVAGVVTTNNTFIPCELVIAAIGTQPDIALAQRAPIVAYPGQGIRVDAHMRTSARDVYAAGAVAAALDPQTGRYDARGQWYFAVQQGRLAAAAMAGAAISEEVALGASGAFWHATQFDKLNVLVAGAPTLSEQAHPDNEVLTNGSGNSYRRIVVRHRRLIGYLAIGPTQTRGLSVKRLIDERVDVEEIKRKLLVEDFDLRSFFTQRRLHALATGKAEVVPRPVPVLSRQVVGSLPPQSV